MGRRWQYRRQMGGVDESMKAVWDARARTDGVDYGTWDVAEAESTGEPHPVDAAAGVVAAEQVCFEVPPAGYRRASRALLEVAARQAQQKAYE